LVYFGPFGIFCGILVYYVVFWYILWYFVVFCGILWYFVVFWFISPRFGILDQEKSGNPDPVLDRFLDFKIRFSTGISQPKRTHTHKVQTTASAQVQSGLPDFSRYSEPK
jgi:hypothetical protein